MTLLCIFLSYINREITVESLSYSSLSKYLIIGGLVRLMLKLSFSYRLPDTSRLGSAQLIKLQGTSG